MPQAEMKVYLLRYTPVPEEIIALAAKLCYSAADMTELAQGIAERDQQPFLQKLMELEHLSPIEHAVFTFGVEGVSRALLTQITRHRIASFSVKSQRYVGEADFCYIIPPRIQELGPEAVAEFERQMAQINQWYRYWQERLGGNKEASNEDARFVLPNAAETKFVVTMNARELLHFFSLRCCNRAQWEIRALAERMLALVKEVAPVLFAQAGPGCLRGPCPEGAMTCGQAARVRASYLGKGGTGQDG